jgi:uncharacterized protein YoaH (UPF0181 family)
MIVCTEFNERRSPLSALETIQLILSFGMFTIALIKLIVDMLKNDKKNNRQLWLVRLFFISN